MAIGYAIDSGIVTDVVLTIVQIEAKERITILYKNLELLSFLFHF